MLSKHIYVGLAVALSLSVSSAAWAVPSLGVATHTAYVGESGQSSLEDYQSYFASTLISGTDATHGFLIGPSGDSLLVFTNITGSDIYLMTDADTYTQHAPAFTGFSPLVQFPDTGQFAAYAPLPYYGVDLGHADTWATLPSSPFTPGTFHVLSVPLTYTGTLDSLTHFFAVGDVAGVGEVEAKGKYHDDFSPQTTSSIGGDGGGDGGNPHVSSSSVPEPVSAGLSLIGLASLALTTTRRRGAWEA